MPPPGIYRTPTGFRVVACIGRGKGNRREKAFPRGTADRVMLRWKRDTETELRTQPRIRPDSLEADVVTYLNARTAMPTHKDRKRHLALWAEALGVNVDRNKVTPLQIRTVLDHWHASGSSAGTCNRRRTALQSLYTVLNGRSGYNPVRDVPKLREPEQAPRKLDYATFDALLAAMPDQGQRHAGASPREVSQTKARLRVIAYTGLPHAQVARLRPEHVMVRDRLVLTRGRHKGAGTADTWLPVSHAGLEAIQAMFAAGAIGPFSRSSMYKSLKRAAVKIGRPELRPYDLRHLFGQTVLRLTKNRPVTRDLMLHRSDKTTARYVASEIPGEWRAALDQFDAEVVGTRCGTASPQAEEA